MMLTRKYVSDIILDVMMAVRIHKKLHKPSAKRVFVDVIIREDVLRIPLRRTLPSTAYINIRSSYHTEYSFLTDGQCIILRKRKVQSNLSIVSYLEI